jgi:hypothetical protein
MDFRAPVSSLCGFSLLLLNYIHVSPKVSYEI